MKYRCVIWKDRKSVLKPTGMSDSDWENFLNENDSNLDDFESNYKGQITNVITDKKYPFDVEIPYAEFKDKVTDWSKVTMRDDGYRYVLYVEVG